MRIIPFAAALLLVACPLAATAAAPKSADFIAWALNRGAECDKRWDRILERADMTPAAQSASEPDEIITRRSTPGPSISATGPSVDFCSPSGLVHKTITDSERLPQSTRERGDPIRGSAMIDFPVSARLATAFDRFRPLSGSVAQRFSIPSRQSVTRPRLNTFGRFSQSTRRGGPAHPGSRPSRPRMF
jgi:hypothetical protein